MKYFYAVHAGRKQGVFSTWSECEQQVKGFPGAKYKKFSSVLEAEQFVAHGFSACSKSQEKSSCTSLPKDSDSEKLHTTNYCVQHKRKRTRCSELKFDAPCSKKQKQETDFNDTSSALPPVKMEQYTVVYTDGACSKNGKKGCKAGYGVWWGDNHAMNLSCKLHGIQTNQRAEIAAVNAAIKQAKEAGIRALTVKTDSMFIINCVTKWVHGWKKKNWIKADGKPVVHKAEFLEMLQYMKDVAVRFEHVPGHKGILGNEMADRLAVAGIGKR